MEGDFAYQLESEALAHRLAEADSHADDDRDDDDDPPWEEESDMERARR